MRQRSLVESRIRCYTLCNTAHQAHQVEADLVLAVRLNALQDVRPRLSAFENQTGVSLRHNRGFIAIALAKHDIAEYMAFDWAGYGMCARHQTGEAGGCRVEGLVHGKMAQPIRAHHV